MKLKVGDKVILNKTGRETYLPWSCPKLKPKGVFGIIKQGDLRGIVAVSWYNSKKVIVYSKLHMYANCMDLAKKPTHNHPLTSIFADKMPKRPKSLTKTRKRVKVKK